MTAIRRRALIIINGFSDIFCSWARHDSTCYRWCLPILPHNELEIGHATMLQSWFAIIRYRSIQVSSSFSETNKVIKFMLTVTNKVEQWITLTPACIQGVLLPHTLCCHDIHHDPDQDKRNVREWARLRFRTLSVRKQALDAALMKKTAGHLPWWRTMDLKNLSSSFKGYGEGQVLEDHGGDQGTSVSASSEPYCG